MCLLKKRRTKPALLLDIAASSPDRLGIAPNLRRMRKK
ncbi:hypothetical protein ALP99_102709 [Pseudomonas syringae pv. tomato]|uniref:Uncharacterized protein n=2 Tax=Pseudomonas syringae group TaxID=136849 RepID=A0A0N0WSU1_PSEYM|nr:Unknown protein sequence [Pseudomonas syringae pv. maculicola]KPC13091.1 Unknown protein sequence [Pseudomonas amygdali pv. lachrymans]KPY09030.1 hypothetical protein ALO54_102587 [Pseudomonas syringae pv. philadelphi]RMM04943.1 hypothetical protein ALQ85_102675 [Pseudomonas syringae]RMM22119.1 hypothetical protein ALQ83_102660 [Pseudomonas syringae pv. berberidis]RMO88227.1 hypothetical protein ALQ32_102337 [Pseudomonas syringae pv. tagetis]RMQ65825.1 hypothetical protein ALQ00_102625 [Ps